MDTNRPRETVSLHTLKVAILTYAECRGKHRTGDINPSNVFAGSGLDERSSPHSFPLLNPSL